MKISEKRLAHLLTVYDTPLPMNGDSDIHRLVAEIRRLNRANKELNKKCRRYEGIIKDEQATWKA